MVKLTDGEILRIVNLYIGVNNGYLGDFSYRTHSEFYPTYCGLEKKPNDINGTTRERFIRILKDASSDEQSKIILGVLSRFPVEDKHRPPSRTKILFDELTSIAKKLSTSVDIPVPTEASDVVKQAFKDIEILIEKDQLVSCVDRIFSAAHGYMQKECEKIGLVTDRDLPITRLFKLLRQNHPAFSTNNPQNGSIEKILNSLANILDAFMPIRNNSSLAHPNDKLLEKCDALLVVNTGWTIVDYVEKKIYG